MFAGLYCAGEFRFILCNTEKADVQWMEDVGN